MFATLSLLFLPIPSETPKIRTRFDKKWILDGECHRWTGCKRGPKEYGGFQIGYRLYNAHRVAYVWAYGEPNCDLHHTCDNAWCVNPEHVTPASAGQRRHRSPSPNFCAHGHEFTPENTYINPRGERQCRSCLREASRRYSERNRDAVNAKKRANREPVVYDERPCEICGRPFKPERSTARYCKQRDCINSRQRENRLGRLGSRLSP